MKKYKSFLSENFHFLVVKFSVYLNRRVFVMFQAFTFFVTAYLFLLQTLHMLIFLQKVWDLGAQS